MRIPILLFFATILLAACESNSNTGWNSDTPSPKQTASTSSNAGGQDFVIKNGDNELVAELHFGKQVVISFGNHQVYSKIGSSGKRKYLTSNEKVITKVNTYDDAFKLKTEAGDLQWKVKISDEKIKIDDNEEMRNPYEIKFANDRMFKLKRGEYTMAEGAYAQQAFQVKGESGTYVLEASPSRGAGVLAIDAIPMEMRLIILSEIELFGK